MNLAPTGWTDPRRRPVGWDWPTGRRRTRLEGLLRNDPLYVAAGLPSWDQNYAEDRNLIDRISGRRLITFTRASTATYIGPDGQLRTAAVNEPRFQHDPATGRCLGLLFEAANTATTNFLLNSDVLQTQNVTVTARPYALSFTGTGTITLSGASTAGPLVGTGDGEANRVSLLFTPSAGTLTVTVSGNVVNAQLENGQYVSSYIPTSGTAVTRQNDQFTVTGTNFSSWYNQSEGTAMVDIAAARPSDNQGPFLGFDGDANYRNNASEWRCEADAGRGNIFSTTAYNSSSQQVVTTTSFLGSPSEYSAANNWIIPYLVRGFFAQSASQYAAGGGSASRNIRGAASGVKSIREMPFVNRAIIDGGGGSANAGHRLIIARHAYWPYAFSRQILQGWSLYVGT